MTGSRAYLDYNATAPLLPEARAAMIAALDMRGNPSSVHAEGRQARHVIEVAREQVASLVGARPSEVVFTSGATEANATVLAQRWDSVFLSRIEHDSVVAPAHASGAVLVDLGTHASGMAWVETGIAHVLKSPCTAGRALVALQLANNETGVLQPVAQAADFARTHGLLMHCDAVQGVGRMPIDFRALDIDTMSLSAHKIGGPKGAGALIIRDGLDIVSLIRGGGQERRRRAGTENVAAIAGFGAAARAARHAIADAGRQRSLRDRLEREVLAMTPSAVVIGAAVERLPNTSCIALPGRLAETLVIRLDLAGVAISAGAACSSGKVGASPALTAMGLPAEIARGAIRVSLGTGTIGADIDAFLAAWHEIAHDARRAA